MLFRSPHFELYFIVSGNNGVITKWQYATTSSFASPIDISSTLNQNINSYTASGLTVTTYYRALINNGACTAYTNTATLTVDSSSVGGTLAGSGAICVGSNSPSMSLSGQRVTIIRWESSTASNFSSNVTTINNTTASYVASGLTATTYFRVLVKNGACDSAYSTAATVTVNQTSVGGTVSGGGTICRGSSATLTLGSNLGSIVKWQWSASADFSTTITDTAVTANPLTINNLTSTRHYRAVVQNGVCAATNSGTASIIVSQLSVAGTISGA